MTPNGRVFRLCDGCLTLARCRFGIQSEFLDSDGIAHCEIVCPPEHQAGPGTAHGGWTAAVMEELLGRVIYLNDVMSVAGELAVRYERPVPVGAALTGRSWVLERKPRKWHLAAELLMSNSTIVAARGTGTFVLIDAHAHYERFDRWLREQKD